MSKNESVTLNIRPGNTPGQGWTNVIASNGQPYQYNYQGGHDNTGGMKTKVGDGTATLNLALSTDQRYSLGSVTFADDPYSQLTWAANPDMKSGTITDVNTQVENAYYQTLVYDAQAGNASIPCDPMIGNDPRGPMCRIMHQ